jgi:hypothetical protein
MMEDYFKLNKLEMYKLDVYHYILNNGVKIYSLLAEESNKIYKTEKEYKSAKMLYEKEFNLVFISKVIEA